MSDGERQRYDRGLTAFLGNVLSVDLHDVQGARSAVSQAKGLGWDRHVAKLQERISTREARVPTRDGSEISVRVYEPNGSYAARAGLLFMHGGAFVLGDLEIEHIKALRLAADARCVVVSVDYRLAPEHQFPVPLDDCLAALDWLVSNADELGVDSARIGVAGTSAGGCLAAAVTLVARDRGGPKLAYQLLTYPGLDVRCSTASMSSITDAPGWDPLNNRLMWRLYLGEFDVENVPDYASPSIASDLSGLPPAYVLAVGCDCLRDEAIDYALRLMQAGVPVELHCVPAAFHGFETSAYPASLTQRVIREQARAVRGGLRRQPGGLGAAFDRKGYEPSSGAVR